MKKIRSAFFAIIALVAVASVVSSSASAQSAVQTEPVVVGTVVGAATGATVAIVLGAAALDIGVAGPAGLIAGVSAAILYKVLTEGAFPKDPNYRPQPN